TESKSNDGRKGQIATDQQTQIHERFFPDEFDDNEKWNEDRSENRAVANERAAKPILSLAFFQHSDKSTQSDGHAENSPPIPGTKFTKLHRFFVNAIQDRCQHDRTWNEVDIKVPLPSIAIRAPPTERRTNCGCERSCHPEHRLTNGQQIFRHCAYDDSQGHGNENAAGKSLARAEHDHLTQARGDSAQRAEQKEK